MIQTADQSKAKGLVFVTIADPTKAPKLYDKIVRLQKKGDPDNELRGLIACYNRIAGVYKEVFENIVPTVGRTAIAQVLTGNISDFTNIRMNYVALGSGITAPNNADTTLDTEVFRKDFASRSFNNNVAYFTAFYTAADVSGTFYEHGIFIGGTAAADSGVLLSRVLLNAPTGIAKSASETLTIEHQITFN